MINRILCALFGHRSWGGMGWLGSNGFDEMVHKYCCGRCGIIVYSMEPNWHLRARYDKRIYPYDCYIEYPDKYDLSSPSYSEQLALINGKYHIHVLASIHETTIDELKKIGYKEIG